MDKLTSVQLSEWEAYDRIDPLGTWRDDFRMAFLSSLITNLTISVHGKKGAKQTTLLDFMPEWDLSGKKAEVKVQSLEEMKKVMLDIAKAQNKKETKKANSKRPPTNLKPKE